MMVLPNPRSVGRAGGDLLEKREVGAGLWLPESTCGGCPPVERDRRGLCGFGSRCESRAVLCCLVD